MVKFFPYRKKKPWIVTWRSSLGTVLNQGFATEEDARAFEESLQVIAQKEKELLKRRKRGRVSSEKIKVCDLLEQYLAALVNPTTKKQNRYHAAHLINAFGQRQASRLKADDALAFMAAQEARGVARITATRRLSILRAALNWGVAMRILTTNPLKELRLQRDKPKQLDPPTRAEARAIFAVASQHVQRVLILGLHTGARVGPSELFRLRWKDIELEEGLLWMPCAQKNRKRDARREVPISPHIMPALNAWRKQDMKEGQEYVIHYGGKPVRSISKAWHGALRRAGISRRIRPYDLRHCFASTLLAEQADSKSVAEIMWHDVKMLLSTYQHIDRAQKRKAIDKMPNILEL